MALTLCSGAAHAQSKANVILRTTAEDSVGRQLVFRLRERITASSTLKVATGSETGLEVRLTTLDPSKDDRGDTTIYALVLTLPSDSLPYYLTNYVGICSRDLVASCADDIFSHIGEQLETIRSALAK